MSFLLANNEEKLTEQPLRGARERQAVVASTRWEDITDIHPCDTGEQEPRKQSTVSDLHGRGPQPIE